MDRPSLLPPPVETARGRREHFVHGVDGTRLFVESTPRTPASTGKEPPRLYFCDGIACDGFIWKYAWEALAPVGPITHWYYRGHGRSGAPKDGARIGIEAHADDLAEVRRADAASEGREGLGPAVLLGHSMGTQVCLEHWHRHREGIRAIVLLCGSYGKVTSTFRGTPILDWLLPKLVPFVDQHAEMVRALWSRLPADLALKAGLRAGEIDPARMNPEDLRPYLEHMVHVDLPMFLRMLRAAGEHSAEAWLGEIDVPVLVVAGEKDTFTPASLSTFMAEAIPKAELLVAPAGTHAAPLEGHEAINGRILEFLGRVLGGA